MTANTNAPAEARAPRDPLARGIETSVAPLDGALWLVRHGFYTFTADHPATRKCTGIGRAHDPVTCDKRGKHPCVAFTRAATLDERKVREWFTPGLRNPAVSVGACAGPNGEQLLVVDSDRVGAIEDLAGARGEQWPATMRVWTAKGHHDYLWAPAALKLGNGLGALQGQFDGDVRAGNAYVIGPGALHASGVLYELDDPEQPPVLAPAWLLDALVTKPQFAARRTRWRDASRPASGRGRGLVAFVLDSRPGDRNNRLFWAACRAAEDARDGREDARGELLAAAVESGLDEREALATIRSAYQRTGATA